MTVLWLIVWVVGNTPAVTFNPPNNWGVALGVCLVVDVLRLNS